MGETRMALQQGTESRERLSGRTLRCAMHRDRLDGSAVQPIGEPIERAANFGVQPRQLTGAVARERVAPRVRPRDVQDASGRDHQGRGGSIPRDPRDVFSAWLRRD